MVNSKILCAICAAIASPFVLALAVSAFVLLFFVLGAPATYLHCDGLVTVTVAGWSRIDDIPLMCRSENHAIAFLNVVWHGLMTFILFVACALAWYPLYDWCQQHRNGARR